MKETVFFLPIESFEESLRLGKQSFGKGLTVATASAYTLLLTAYLLLPALLTTSHLFWVGAVRLYSVALI